MQSYLCGTLAAAATLLPDRACADPPTIITTLPAVITIPGVYTLATNHTVSLVRGAAIEVQADNVTIDLGGFTISNSGAPLGTNAVGIFARDKIGLTVTNGTIRLFHTAVCAKAPTGRSSRHEISSILAVDFLAAGFLVGGSNLVLRDNQIHRSPTATIMATGVCSAHIMGIGISHCERAPILDNELLLSDAGDSNAVIGVYAGGPSHESRARFVSSLGR